MLILGLDLSLTSTGATLLKGRRPIAVANFKTSPADGADVERGEKIASELRDWIEENGLPDRIGIEDYAHSKATNVSRLGELGGCVKRMLWLDLGRDPRAVIKMPSSTVKKFATGNGRASKDEMIAAAAPYLEDFPFLLATCEDVCDSLHVARWTRDYLRKM